MAKKQKGGKKEKKELEETITEIKQRFGEGAIMKLKETQPADVDVIPTGSISLDSALGVGGVPRGRVIEIFGPEMTGKCVKSDTLIFSELGMLPIFIFGDPQKPEFQKKGIFLYSEKSYEKTSHFYNGGSKPTIRIKTNYGYELEGTPNHRIRILDKEGNYLFRRLDELQPNDYVAIQRGQNCFGKGVDLSDFEEKIWSKIKSKMNTSKKDFKNFRITKEMARLMGYMVGDGTCTARGLNKNNIQISNANEETESDFRRVCFKLFGEEPKITPDKRTKNTKRLTIYNTKARAFLNYAGVGFWYAEQKEIPWSIMCSPKPIVANFLKALFECDGGVGEDGIEYSSKSEKLIKQLQIVLLNFGIISKIKPRYNYIYKRYYYHLYIDGQRDREEFAKEIGFISLTKRKKLEKLIKETKQFHTIRDVVPNLNNKLGNFLQVYRKKIRGTNRKDWKIFHDYLPTTRGYSQISYDRLKRILKRFSDGRDLPEYQELEDLFNLGFFWDKVVEKQTSFSHVFDFTVPSNATFCGNGFVNHNTTLALHILAEVQKRGGVAAFVDAEHALDPDYAQKIGVNVDDLLISQPDSGEQALQIVESLVRSGQVDAIVIDSVAALTPRAEIEGEMGEFQIGLQARMMSQACLVGETELIDPLTGKISTIEKVIKKKLPWHTLSYNEKRGKFIISSVIDWLPQGKRECFELKTKDGHTLKLTDDHLVLTLDGWKEVKSLATRDCLAIPRKAPEPQSKLVRKKLTNEEVKIIAYIIGDGNFTVSNYNLTFSNIDPEIIKDFNNSLQTLNCELYQKKRGEYRIRKKKNLPLGSCRSPTKELLRREGVFGKKSPEKEVPPKIFKISNEQLSLFISRLWSCDGHVDTSDTARAVVYSSSSLQLIKQLQTLLLRFGIVARWRQKRLPPHPLYVLTIQGRKNIQVFASEIGLVGKKSEKLKALATREWKSKVTPFQDIIPYQLVSEIKTAVYASGHTGQEISHLLGMYNRTSFPEYRSPRRRVSREHLEKIATFIGNKELQKIAEDEVYWSKIDSITPIGKRMVYDLTIKDRPNFVANGVVVHNCRKLSGIVSKTKTSVIFLNQTRMKIGVRFGSPETTSGGLALKFYSSVRINLRRIAKIKHGDEIIGSRIKAKIVKNKVAAPFKTAEFDIYYNEGISYTADVINTGVKLGIIDRAGSWLKYKNKKLGQGLEASKEFLKENPELTEEIKQAILEASEG